MLTSGGCFNPIRASVVHSMIETGSLDRHLAKLNRVYTQRSGALFRALHKTFPADTLEFVEPTGGYFGWVRFTPASKVRSTTDLFQFLHRHKQQYRVTFMPGSRCTVAESVEFSGGCEVADGRYDAYFRVCWAFHEVHELVEGVRRLRRAYDDYVPGAGGNVDEHLPTGNE